MPLGLWLDSLTRNSGVIRLDLQESRGIISKHLFTQTVKVPSIATLLCVFLVVQVVEEL